jgi:hypothetical protein
LETKGLDDLEFELSRKRFILKGLKEKENKSYYLIFIGARKTYPILEGKWKVVLEKKKRVF